MAWIGLRVCVSKLFNPTTTNGALCKTNWNAIYRIQSANISSLALQKSDIKRPAPYPYREKDYTFLNALFDHTTYRFDENSKIIVVDGPIAAGKSSFAQTLAQELGMLYIPEATMDNLYINEYHYDMRQLDSKLPKSCQSFDVKNFCRTPNHENVANFQILMYYLRYSQYVDALAHVLSTGQGVVLDRCAYGDFVFVETMFKYGYLSKGARSVYYDIHANTITELMKPHLVVYLDVPVDVVADRIKKRKLPYEVSSKVFTPEYLTTMEEVYKQRYLKEISAHAELLIYDWSDHGDVEVVVEDIERINFDRFDKYDPKMKDWRLADEWEWNNTRMMYTSNKPFLMNYFKVPRFDVPELIIDGHDAWQCREIWWNAPGMKYKKGYNADMGDTGILTKTFTDYKDGK